MASSATDSAVVNNLHSAVIPPANVMKRIPTAPKHVRIPTTALAVKYAHVVNVARSAAPDAIAHSDNSVNAVLALLAARLTPTVPPTKAASKANVPIRVLASQLVVAMRSALSPIIVCYAIAPMAMKVNRAKNACNSNVRKMPIVSPINAVMLANVAIPAWNMAHVELMLNVVWWIANHNVHAHPTTLAAPKLNVAHCMAAVRMILAAQIPNV